MKHQNIIEINGKRYNATTGQAISTSAHEPKNHNPKKRSLDGFIPGKAKARKNLKVAEPTHTTTESARPHTPKHVTHHKTQKSQSLMRKAVRKPAAESSKHIVPKQNPARLQRAQKTPLSKHISRFSSEPKTHKPTPTLQVAKQPKQAHTQAVSAAPSHEAKPVSAAQKHFEVALTHATAHEQQHTKKQKRGAKAAKRLGISRKVMNVSAAMLAVVLLAGFFAYQNMSAISMQIASSRAGIDAKLPGYQPTGFSVSGPIEYQPGSISVDFSSRTDDREFTLTQTASKWNSNALVENFLGKNNKTYQTHEDKGKTIYVYDRNNATWVSGGIWYNVESNSTINNDQLLRMVGSL